MAEVRGLTEVTAVLGLAEMTEVLGLTEMIEALGLAEMTGPEKCTKQLALTVEMSVRYHLSQKITGQFIAESVFKITNHKNVVALVLVEALGLAEMIEVLGLTEIQDSSARNNCHYKMTLQGLAAFY